MPRLLLVRHGETEHKSSQRYWGATDVKLSALGLKQAVRLRARLATEEVKAVYSSDLERARVTAQTIAAGHRLPVTTCRELREIDFGKLEGLTFDEISRNYPEVTAVWKNGSLKLEFPGGDSVSGFNRRVSRFHRRLAKHAPDEMVVITAHEGSLRILLCRLLGLRLEHRRRFRFNLASLSIVETYPSGGILMRLNDVSHLDGV